jgi:hypothetical protein
MLRFDGSLARTLDFGHITARNRLGADQSSRRPRPRLGLLRRPDKYKTLEKRRRAAQIRARHALDLVDMMEQSGGKGR